jgi:hypothetical protein
MKSKLRKIIDENNLILPVSFSFIEVVSSKKSSGASKIINSIIHQTKNHSIQDYYKILNVDVPKNEK